MEEALRNIFGPWVSLIGFGVMILMFAPKVVSWWRRKKQLASGKDDTPKVELEPRTLTYPDDPPSMEPHPRFGPAAAELRSRKQHVLLRSLAWLLPLAINLLLPDSMQLRIPLLLVTIPLAIVGLWSLQHVGDHAVFYHTGFTIRYGMVTREIDYNAISSFRKRTDLNGLASSFIFRIDHDSPVSFECSRFFDGVRTVSLVIQGLSQRTVKDAIPSSRPEM